jgi:hypothetical protein
MFFFAVETWHLSPGTAKIIAPCKQCEINSTTILVDLLQGIVLVMFLLCPLATSSSTLATVRTEDLVPALHQWWKTVSHLRGLNCHCCRRMLIFEADYFDPISPTQNKELRLGLYDYRNVSWVRQLEIIAECLVGVPMLSLTSK